MNPQTTNPMFAKFDQVLGKTTPTTSTGSVKSRADEIRSLDTQSQPVQASKQTPSFAGMPKAGMGDTQAIPDKSTPDTGAMIKNTAKSMVSGTIESGKDIAAAIGAPQLQSKFDKIDESDRNYLGTLIQLRNKAAGVKDVAKVNHFQNLIKTYKMTDGEKVSDVFPEINKSPEQIIGDFASMGLEVVSAGNLADAGAEKAAQFGEKGGLSLGNRLLEGAKTGGKYGSLFGVTGAMQNNEDASGIVKSGAIGGATGAILGAGTEGAFGKRATEGVAGEESKKINDLVGKIIQGDAKDIPAATEALGHIDLKDINSNKDLFTALDTRVKALSEAQDTHLNTTKGEAIPHDKLVVTTKVGDQTVTHNFVDDALTQLKAFYDKTNDVKGSAEIGQLIEKAKGLSPEETNKLKIGNLTDASYVPPQNGLTLQDVNDLAKLHGQELSGFNANGELASGLSKQAAENTRTGLKATVRQLAGDEGGKASEAIDKSISNAIRTRDLVGEVTSKVQDLKQRVTERGWGEKAGRALFQITDKLTGGGLKGFIQSFVPRGEGLKIMNALDLEKGLGATLKQLDGLLNSGDEEGFVKSVQSFIKDTGKALLKNSEDVPNKQGGFIKIGGQGFSQIPDATKSEMVKVIDYLRSGKSSSNIEDTVSKLSEKYNIPENWSNTKIADKFEDLIDKTKTS